jgi:ferredoxin
MNSPITPPLYTAHYKDLQCDAWADQPLLASMEQGGMDWPSSCRNGTCRTCIGRMSAGKVRYEVEWPGITTEEQEEGCVLPCIAYPESDVVLEGPLYW